MEMLVSFYGDALAFFDKINANSIGKAWGVLAENRQLVTALFALFITFYFMQVALGYSRGSISDAAVSAMKMVLAYALIMSWPDFNDLAGDLLIKGPEEIGTAIASRMGGIDVANGMAGLVQNVALKSYNFAATVMQANEGWVSPNVTGFLVMTLVLIGLIPLLLVLTGVTLFGKFITTLMLAIGPFAIMAYFFDKSRFIFESWIKALAYGSFMIIFTFVVLGLSFSLVEQVVDRIFAGDLTNTGVFAKAVGLALYLLLIVFFVWKIPAFALAFAYGTAIHIDGMKEATAKTMSTAASAGFGAVKFAGRGAVRSVRASGGLSRQLTARLRGRKH